MPKFDEIKLAGQLPSPKGVALAIMNLCGRDDTTIDDIARLVQTDPALSGRLLRLANTSGGGHRPIAAVNEALLRIGMKAVGQLAMGFSLVDQFKEGPCKAFDYRSFWSHSLLMALAARELGRLTRVAAPEDLFACGLMANIGSLALATAFPVEYSALLESGSHDPLAAERETFGIDRRECTLAMLEDFGIPKALAEPVFYHLAPDESQFSDASRPSRLTWLFHTAHHLADLGVASKSTPTVPRRCSTVSLPSGTSGPDCWRSRRPRCPRSNGCRRRHRSPRSPTAPHLRCAS
jgi:HD-like signal output (HDOD) protein